MLRKVNKTVRVAASRLPSASVLLWPFSSALAYSLTHKAADSAPKNVAEAPPGDAVTSIEQFLDFMISGSTLSQSPTTESPSTESPDAESPTTATGGLKVTTDLPDPSKLGRNRLVICVVGKVSTGKSSLVKAFFGMNPEANPNPNDKDQQQQHDLFQVDAQAGTTKRATGIMLETPPIQVKSGSGSSMTNDTGKVVVFDLPGLHEAASPEDDEDEGGEAEHVNGNGTAATSSSVRTMIGDWVWSDWGAQPKGPGGKGKGKGKGAEKVAAVNKNIEAYLRKDVVDVGIFVIDGVITDTIQEDYRRLCAVAKKVFLVFNKIDTLDYLKAERREKILEDARIKLGADEIFPTACKGFDPNADRSQPNWCDVRGIEELKKAVYSFVYEHKHAEFLSMVQRQEFWRNARQIGFQTVLGVGVVALAVSSRAL